MFKFQVDDFEVSLNTDLPGAMMSVSYSTNTPDDFRQWLPIQSGAFGHEIGEVTSAIDLHYVLSNQDKWQFKLIEGNIDSYDPDIPDGAVP